jgi:predicted O-linked N-acetylglucosamine transferase (SPINDLY family)
LRACEHALDAGVDKDRLIVNWCFSLGMLGRHEEALQRIDDALAKRPGDYDLVNLKGVLLKRADRVEESLDWFHRAIRLKPNHGSAWKNLGNSHDLLGNFPEAAKAFRRAAKIAPEDDEILRLLGRALYHAGDYPETVKVLRRLVWMRPQNEQAWKMLVTVLVKLGKRDELRQTLEQARTRLGDSPLPDIIAAQIDLDEGRIDEAIACLRAVQARLPGEHASGIMLGNLLESRDPQDSLTVLERTLNKNPDASDVLRTLVHCYGRARHGNEASHLEKAYALAIRLQDRFPRDRLRTAHTCRDIFSRMLDLDRHDRAGSHDELLPHWVAQGQIASIHYELGRVRSLDDRLRIVDAHRRWGEAVEARIRPLAPLGAPAVHGRRRLRIGFMSSDLRNHPVTYFALPLLEQFDADKVEVYCYSFSTKPKDRLQEYIEQKVSAFRWWPAVTDAQAAEGIRQDELDLLFELGGTTAMNKLNVMAYRPARIGASWLGYPHSAGLSRIDYIVVDPHILPTDPRLLVEQPLIMPESWVAVGRPGFPEIAIDETLPEDRRGAITFGTANNPYKFTRECLDAWARVMARVDNARFLFLRPEAATEGFRRNARTIFAERNVDPSRIDFVGVRGTHMAHYNSIDIALDSFPHVGGTTTCEALWMGVPTVTLAGPGFPERLAHSNLVNAGLTDLSAGDPERFVDLSVALASDKPRRAALRRDLRTMIRSNPLGQQHRFVREFYARAAVIAE